MPSLIDTREVARNTPTYYCKAYWSRRAGFIGSKNCPNVRNSLKIEIQTQMTSRVSTIGVSL